MMRPELMDVLIELTQVQAKLIKAVEENKELTIGLAFYADGRHMDANGTCEMGIVAKRAFERIRKEGDK